MSARTSARERRDHVLRIVLPVAVLTLGLAVWEAVVRIERRDGRAAIAHTPFGLYHADVFVLAAGAWSGLPGVSGPLMLKLLGSPPQIIRRFNSTDLLLRARPC